MAIQKLNEVCRVSEELLLGLNDIPQVEDFFRHAGPDGTGFPHVYWEAILDSWTDRAAHVRRRAPAHLGN